MHVQCITWSRIKSCTVCDISSMKHWVYYKMGVAHSFIGIGINKLQGCVCGGMHVCVCVCVCGCMSVCVCVCVCVIEFMLLLNTTIQCILTSQ